MKINWSGGSGKIPSVNSELLPGARGQRCPPVLLPRPRCGPAGMLAGESHPEIGTDPSHGWDAGVLGGVCA